MQLQYQENDTVSLPGNVHSASPSLAPSSQEPYYSNQDIAVLHAVITAAQEQLDHSPDPKPLPAAALFKAYDEVLPQHGIDPDSDHHLSTLVFRVGGEQGNGTLSQKFQVILGRMGIVLEFGDESTASIRSGRSRSLSPAPSYSSHVNPTRKRRNLEEDASQNTTQKSNIIPRHEVAETQAAAAEVSDMDIDFDNRRSLAAAHITTSPARANVHTLAAGHLQHQECEDPTIPSNHRFIERETKEVAFKDNEGNDPRLPPQHPTNHYNPSSNVRRATLASVIDRWRDAMNKQRMWKMQNFPSGGRDKRGNQAQSRGQVENQSQSQLNSPPHVDVKPQASTLPMDVDMVVTKEHREPHVLLVDHDVLKHDSPVAMVPKENLSPNSHASNEVHTSQGEHEQLLNRAARARELYLASKVFNHWADRTAMRLEREGVARRHMVRFRCFRGWSQVPSSRAPAIDQLRTVTAVQKLQRAVAYQEEQLSIAASAIAQSYRLKTVLRVCDRWRCHLMVDVSRQRSAQRTTNNAVMTWKSQLAANAAVKQTMQRRKEYFDTLGALSSWQRQAQSSSRRLEAARQVGMLRMSFEVLGEWWDRAEVERRAMAYREKLLLKAAAHAFYSWNLQARAQAFRWRNDYLSVTRALGKLRRSTAEDRCRQDNAVRFFASRCACKFLGVMKRANDDRAQLLHLDSRARLFIVATRILPVISQVIEKRKRRAKEMVRRHLMMRYTQVSSARKKRMFYTALDHWRATTAQMHEGAELAAMSVAERDVDQLRNVVSKWRKRTDEDSRLQSTTSKYHRQAWLATWCDLAKEHEQRDMQAWDQWASGKQRQYLKEWSISSLQRSGQAHTATMVQQKYYGEKRNRTYQQWRQASANASDALTDQNLRFTPKPGSAAGHRSGWRALSSRRYLLKEGLHEQDVATGPVETPTRWTGLPLSMSFALSSRPMPPVREMDEESVLSSADGDLEMLKPPNKAHTGTVSISNLPSTTPRAPVPIHLNLDALPSQNARSTRFNRGMAMRSARAKSASPSKEAPYHPAEPTTRSHLDQPRNALRHSTQGIAPRYSSRQPDEIQGAAFKSLDPIGQSRSAGAQPYRSLSAASLQPRISKTDGTGFRSPWPRNNVRQNHSRSLTSIRLTK